MPLPQVYEEGSTAASAVLLHEAFAVGSALTHQAHVEFVMHGSSATNDVSHVATCPRATSSVHETSRTRAVRSILPPPGTRWPRATLATGCTAAKKSKKKKRTLQSI